MPPVSRIKALRAGKVAFVQRAARKRGQERHAQELKVVMVLLQHHFSQMPKLGYWKLVRKMRGHEPLYGSGRAHRLEVEEGRSLDKKPVGYRDARIVVSVRGTWGLAYRERTGMALFLATTEQGWS